MRYRVVQDGVAWGHEDRYLIPDGTCTGELLTVWSPPTPEIAIAYAGVTHDIKAAAWASHYGVTVPKPTPEKAGEEVERHMGKNGSIQLAWLGSVAIEHAEVIGYIKHRPIYTKTLKMERERQGIPIGRPVPAWAYIHNIDVFPVFQGMGVGSALVDAALSHYADWVGVRLEATGEQGYTQKWFRQMGLRRPPRRRDVRLNPVLGLAQRRYDGVTAFEAQRRLQSKVRLAA